MFAGVAHLLVIGWDCLTNLQFHLHLIFWWHYLILSVPYEYLAVCLLMTALWGEPDGPLWEVYDQWHTAVRQVCKKNDLG